jgi:hypothetical protein
MLILLTILLTAALSFIYFGLTALFAIRSVSKWPVVQGNINSSDFQCVLQPTEGHGIYRPLLTYNYVFDGHSYKSSQLGINRSSFDYFSEKDIRQFLSQNAVGNPISVHVDPADPSQSFLAPGVSPPRHSHYYALTVSGLILLPVALALLFHYYV